MRPAIVISDAHSGLKMAIASILQGAVWQRCRVHFVRDALALVPKNAQQMVAATIRTVFVQPDAASARTTWRTVGESFRGRFPRPTAMLTEAEDDVLAYANFPSAHWHQVWSTDEIVKVAA
jgi:putative transposase